MRNSLLLVLACLPTAACSLGLLAPGEFGNCFAFCTAFGTKSGEDGDRYADAAAVERALAHSLG